MSDSPQRSFAEAEAVWDWSLGLSSASFWVWAQHFDLVLNIMLGIGGLVLLVPRLIRAFWSWRDRMRGRE